MGLAIASARSLDAINIPSGKPNIKDIITETITIDKVTYIASQRPNSPIENKRAPYSIPFVTFPLIFHEMNTTNNIHTNQGTISKTEFTPLTNSSKKLLIPPKKVSYLILKALTLLSIAFLFISLLF